MVFITTGSKKFNPFNPLSGYSCTCSPLLSLSLS